MSRKAIRETLGFIGVIASLIFVGLEIHQNTLASRAAAIQESTNVVRQQVQMFVTDAEVNRINMIGAEDPSQLNGEEQESFWLSRASPAGGATANDSGIGASLLRRISAFRTA